MLRVTQIKSAESACEYHDEHLCKSDYYSEKSRISGLWGGRGAEALGLSGAVQKEQFHNLCYNINPSTKKQLTARNDADRTTGYDFTFSVPKSVSIIYSQTRDPDILAAMNKAIDYAMQEIERNAETRVRKGGKYENRTTGNLIWSAFTHEETRPINGISDPHLHQHRFVQNASFDPVEKIWKAGNFRNLKMEAPYFQALVDNRLAYELEQVGYETERNERDFEVKGFKRPTIEKYSNRTLEINEKIKELGLKSAAHKAAVGAKTRARKQSDLSKEELQKEWTSRLDADELKLIWSAKNKNRVRGGDETKGEAAKRAIDHALSHGLERKSVIAHNELMILALKHAMGRATNEELEAELNSRKDLLSKEINRKKLYTTKATLQEEQKLIEAARSGRGQFKAIDTAYIPKNELLNEEQKEATRHALQSKDFITIITGGAGTGKTWTVKEIAQGAYNNGMGFHAFAPSAVASREVQQGQGFENATTISELLQSKKFQEQINGGVIWLDEAGQIGCQTLNDVIKIAQERKARLLLTGDTRQHTGVERGDALRILQKFANIKPAYINKIKRQQKEEYKQAIKDLSEGRIEKGFQKLDQMGAIKESATFDEAVAALSKEYVSARKTGEEVLVIATTHKQGQALTGSIREGLKKEGKLAKKDRPFDIQINLSFTEAQKQDHGNYEPGQAIQFHQNVKGFLRGAKYDIAGRDEQNNVIVSDNGKMKILPLSESKKFAIYKKDQLALATGDLIRITQNGFSNDSKRLSNSNILTVKGFTEDGNIIALSGKSTIVLDKNYRNFTHGYYTTSHASQGKSVNRILILQTSQSGKAASKEQFYVSASRGKFSISIHTDDKETLLTSVHKTSTRMSATEISHAGKGRVQQVKEKIKYIAGAGREKIAGITEGLQQKLENFNVMQKGQERER